MHCDIRKVLVDDSRHPRFIKPVPKLGYRFIGRVEEECSPE
jgi:DNA-binding winged helix-turn-helix (wHTH) protein